ncbi:DUF262 domain-containing protein [Thalassospira sp.]|uniref:DUF262 domain-containing protein n=1 Tax=Thalassospira sp. TaxID=1912094 RepID=UPI002624EF62|nr:DUF262 domain-containing protein [Thalassospira sp.]MCH2274854.1 DUF262 domain-containing protein [Thalassospira sp.]
MPYIEISDLRHSNIIRIYSEKENIQTDPYYQREGEVWGPDKKKLLIDSIINGFDLPKLYFHQLERDHTSGKQYSVVDGRQRLETIWDFIEDKFSLDEDFKYLDDQEIKLGKLTYSEIARHYPKIKIRFDSFELPITCIKTDDIDLIEEMFSRLNEAVPLNAAEKRNAIGGHMAQAIREVSEDNFFKKNVSFGNKRYQHREVAARFLLVEHSLDRYNRLIDTKKAYLDAMTKEFKKNGSSIVDEYKRCVLKTISDMRNTFNEKDEILKAQGNMTVYYLLFRDKESLNITRDSIVKFRKELSENKKAAEDDITLARYDLIEYDHMSQQGTNDASSILRRVEILKNYIYGM